MTNILVSGPSAGCLPFFILIVGPSDGELGVSFSILRSRDSWVRDRGLVNVTEELLFLVVGEFSGYNDENNYCNNPKFSDR